MNAVMHNGLLLITRCERQTTGGELATQTVRRAYYAQLRAL